MSNLPKSHKNNKNTVSIDGNISEVYKDNFAVLYLYAKTLNVETTGSRDDSENLALLTVWWIRVKKKRMAAKIKYCCWDEKLLCRIRKATINNYCFRKHDLEQSLVEDT